MKEKKKLILMSKYAGERFDLVQAGGGNSSIKLSEGQVLIKASGYHLSEINLSHGIVALDNRKILEILNNSELTTLDKKKREKFADEMVKNACVTPSTKSSIETYLHALTNKYTLHTHPIVINIIACRPNWKTIFLKQFPASLCISYDTPGIELALNMKKEMEKYYNQFKNYPKVIFLQNHGLIISTDSLEKTIALTENVVLKIEKFLNVDFSSFRMTSKISKIVNEVIHDDKIAYLSTDNHINNIFQSNKEYFSTLPFSPDKMVYCGKSSVELKDENDRSSIEEYLNENKDYPKVIILNNMVFFIADNVKKAKELEDVFKFHLITIQNNQGQKINYLSDDETEYLINWDAEKYRQKL